MVLFNDLSKAYDSIDRDVLWLKMAALGVKGKFLQMLKAYQDVNCAVKIIVVTDWFNVERGLRQGVYCAHFFLICTLLE